MDKQWLSDYNTGSTMLNPIKTHNERGGMSLLSSGIALYNRYFTDWEVDSPLGVRDDLVGVCS